MTTISAMELRRKLGEMLDRAAAGERIVIERDRRPLAVLMPFGGQTSDEAARNERVRRSLAALDRLEEMSLRMRREHPEWAGMPDSTTLLRQERDRDNASER